MLPSSLCFVVCVCLSFSSCVGYLVLGDASAAFSVPHDSDPQEYIWIEDFSETEAAQYFDKREFLIGDANKEKQQVIFNCVCTPTYSAHGLRVLVYIFV